MVLVSCSEQQCDGSGTFETSEHRLQEVHTKDVVLVKNGYCDEAFPLEDGGRPAPTDQSQTAYTLENVPGKLSVDATASRSLWDARCTVGEWIMKHAPCR